MQKILLNKIFKDLLNIGIFVNIDNNHCTTKNLFNTEIYPEEYKNYFGYIQSLSPSYDDIIEEINTEGSSEITFQFQSNNSKYFENLKNIIYFLFNFNGIFCTLKSQNTFLTIIEEKNLFTDLIDNISISSPEVSVLNSKYYKHRPIERTVTQDLEEDLEEDDTLCPEDCDCVNCIAEKGEIYSESESVCEKDCKCINCLAEIQFF